MVWRGDMRRILEESGREARGLCGGCILEVGVEGWMKLLGLDVWVCWWEGCLAISGLQLGMRDGCVTHT